MLTHIINAVPRGYEVTKRMTFGTQMLLLFKLLGGVLLLSQMRKLFLGTRNGSPLDQLSEATSVALQTQESRVALAAVAITTMLLLRRRLSRRAPIGAPPENTLTILPPERISEAAAVAAAAFAEPTRSNAWVAVCGTDASLASRHALLRYIFERNFQLRLRTQCNRALFREGRLVCCFMFVTPDVAHVNLWEMLRVGPAPASNQELDRGSVQGSASGARSAGEARLHAREDGSPSRGPGPWHWHASAETNARGGGRGRLAHAFRHERGAKCRLLRAVWIRSSPQGGGDHRRLQLPHVHHAEKTGGRDEKGQVITLSREVSENRSG